MIRLSAFADEISPDLPEQIAILKRENIAHIDLRGVWNINVLDLTDEQAISIKELLEGHGIKLPPSALPSARCLSIVLSMSTWNVSSALSSWHICLVRHWYVSFRFIRLPELQAIALTRTRGGTRWCGG